MAPHYFILGEEEFANLNIYNIFYDDDKELLFVATNDGVFQYGYSRFFRLEIPKNAKGNSFFEFKEDLDGNIFCRNLNGQIFHVYNGGMKLYHSYPQEDIFEDFKYYFDAENNLWCLARTLQFNRRVKGEIVDTKTVLDKTISINSFHEKKDGFFLLGYRAFSSFEKVEPVVVDSAFNFQTMDGASRDEVVFLEDSVKIFSGVYDQLISLSHKGSVIHQYDFSRSDSRYGKLDDRSMVIYNTKKGVTFLKKQGLTITQEPTLFSDRFISTVHKSSNDILFMGTFLNGLIVIPDWDIHGIESSEMLTDLTFYGDEEVVVGSRSGKLFRYNIPAENESLIAEINANASKVFTSKYKINLYSSSPNLYTLTRGIRDAIDLEDGLIASLSWGGLYIFKTRPSTLWERFKSADFKEVEEGGGLVVREKKMARIAADTIQQQFFISNALGLYKRGYFNNQKHWIKYKGEHLVVSDLIFQNGILYCATRNLGLLVFKDEKLLLVLNEQKGLKSNNLFNIRLNDGILFIHGRKGLQTYGLKEGKFLFEAEIGVFGKDMVDFDVSKEYISILKKNSYYTFPLEKVDQNLKVSTLYVDSFFVNGELGNKNQYDLNYDQNSLVFYVDYRELLTKPNTKIVYTLEGFYDDWKELKKDNHEIEFQSLPEGTYTFRVKAIYQGQASNEFVYKFRIYPPFWQRWWFYLLIFLLAVVLIGTYAFYRLRRIRLQAAQKLEVETSRRIAINAQLKAIRAQMNPHFIFNAINSIQDLVLQKETLKSYDYLESFSRLVRMTLDHSEREFVPLHEEVDFLKLYLELESLRFEEKFDYELTVDGSDQHIIPSLIVQPFVENAIKHGLLHKFGEKQLRISFCKLNDSTIECVVEDNGIGVYEAGKIMNRRGSQHASFSTKAIKNRMNILNEQMNARCGYKIHDLLDEEGVSKGTRVIIILPIRE